MTTFTYTANPALYREVGIEAQAGDQVLIALEVDKFDPPPPATITGVIQPGTTVSCAGKVYTIEYDETDLDGSGVEFIEEDDVDSVEVVSEARVLVALEEAAREAADDLLVKKSGDTMSGALIIDGPSIGLVIKDYGGTIATEGYLGTISTSGELASITTAGIQATISTSGEAASISTLGSDAVIETLGQNAEIRTSGALASIRTTGQQASIVASGDQADIHTEGSFGHIYTSGGGNLSTTGEFYIVHPQTISASNAPGITGQIAWDSNYIYVCVATNTWKRAALSWP